MALLGQHSTLSASLAGSDASNSIEDIGEVNVSISADQGAVQASVVIQELSFVRESRQKLLDWKQAGLDAGVGVLEGVPLTLTVANSSNSNEVFRGYVDSSKAEYDDSNGRIVAPIIKEDTLDILDKRLSGLTFGYLESEGVFSDIDYQDTGYVVEKVDSTFENLFAGVVLFLMTKELLQQGKDLAENVNIGAGLSGTSPTGGIGAAIFATLATILEGIETVNLIIAIIDLGKDFVNTFNPPKRTHKTISYRKAVEKIAGHIGLTLNTDIELLDKFYYLPSNTSVDTFDNRGLIKSVGTVKKGIPKSQDAGYNCSVFFGIVAKMFNAVWSVEGNTLILRNKESELWKNKSSYVMPDILPPAYKLNTDEIISNTTYSFATDISDEYTVTNYKGTSYGVTIQPKTINIPKYNTVGDAKEVRFELALATRKDSLTGFEKTVLRVAKAIDEIINLFGGNSNLSGGIKSKVGAMKVSNNYHRTAKVLYLESGAIPLNHRDILSSKAIYNSSYIQSSPANEGFTGQKLLYSGIELPFNYRNFLQVGRSIYCTDFKGRDAKILELLWNSFTGKARATFEVEQPYTFNLEEVYFEQG